MSPRGARSSWTAGFGSLGPVQPLEARQVIQELNSNSTLSSLNLEFPVGRIDLKFEDDGDGVRHGVVRTCCTVGQHLKHVSRYQGKGHHVLGAIKAANSSGPGNVELRGWREKGGHQQGGEPWTRKADARHPRAETARDRCAVNSMGPSCLIEFS